MQLPEAILGGAEEVSVMQGSPPASMVPFNDQVVSESKNDIYWCIS